MRSTPVSFSVSFDTGKIRQFPLLLLLLSLLLVDNTAALELDNHRDHYSLTQHLSWYTDTSGELSLADVSQQHYREQFIPHRKSTFNIGFVDHPVWFHITLTRAVAEQPSDYAQMPWQLLIDYAPLDRIDIYQRLPDGSLRHQHMGDTLPFNQREFKHHSFITPLFLTDHSATELFIRVQTTGSMQMPLSAYSPKGAISLYSKQDMLYGAYFGIMIIMVLYNLFVFLVLREHSYAYYVLHIITFTLLQGAVSGHAYQYLWPDAPNWNQLSIPVLMHANVLSALLFTRRFLSLPTHLPRLSRFVIAACIIIATAGLFSFNSSYKAGMISGIAIALIGSTTIISCGVTMLLKGHRIARLFLLAWVILDVCAVTHALAAADILPSNPITLHAGLIGASIEVVLLSLALAERFNARIIRSEAMARESSSKLLKANQQLNEALTQQSRLIRLKDSFLATISHELRTPMNGVEGTLALLKTDSMSKKYKDYVEAAKRSARDMTAKIDAILRFSEIQSGELRIKRDAIEIREVLNPLIDEARNKCLQKGLALSFHIDRQVPAIIEGDADQITHVLKQLIDNAVKFTAKGLIRVYVSADALQHERLTLSVIDTGPGIPAGTLAAVFNPFEHAETETGHADRGLGIGLTICKQLVELMGGQLNIDSRAGAGTEITIQLPLRIVAAAPLPTSTGQPLHQSRKTVLIAEDNPVNQLVLKGMLEKLGCMTIIAGNGADVCEILKAQPVDLILMDCQMPLMDGFETTRAIRTSQTAYSNLPIIAVTANAMSQDDNRCLNAGMNDYIRKPINREMLENKVIRWLNCGRMAAF